MLSVIECLLYTERETAANYSQQALVAGGNESSAGRTWVPELFEMERLSITPSTVNDYLLFK